MQTAIRKKLPVLVGLVVLSLVLLAAEAQIVQAMRDVGTGTQTSAVSPAVSGTSGINAALPTPAPGKIAVPSSTASTASSSNTAMIIVGGAIAALAIIALAWALARRSGEPDLDESGRAAYCALHPDDALCRSA